jgi:hypothetical protein
VGVLFDYNSSLSINIFSITEPCFSHIKDLRRIIPILHQTAALNIANALVRFKLDYFQLFISQSSGK